MLLAAPGLRPVLGSLPGLGRLLHLAPLLALDGGVVPGHLRRLPCLPLPGQPLLHGPLPWLETLLLQPGGEQSHLGDHTLPQHLQRLHLL